MPKQTAPAAALPSHIVIEADWRDVRAGKVLVANEDLLAQLTVEGVPYHEASAIDRGLQNID